MWKSLLSGCVFSSYRVARIALASLSRASIWLSFIADRRVKGSASSSISFISASFPAMILPDWGAQEPFSIRAQRRFWTLRAARSSMKLAIFG